MGCGGWMAGGSVGLYEVRRSLLGSWDLLTTYNCAYARIIARVVILVIVGYYVA